MWPRVLPTKDEVGSSDAPNRFIENVQVVLEPIVGPLEIVLRVVGGHEIARGCDYRSTTVSVERGIRGENPLEAVGKLRREIQVDGGPLAGGRTNLLEVLPHGARQIGDRRRRKV